MKTSKPWRSKKEVSMIGVATFINGLRTRRRAELDELMTKVVFDDARKASLYEVIEHADLSNFATFDRIRKDIEASR